MTMAIIAPELSATYTARSIIRAGGGKAEEGELRPLKVESRGPEEVLGGWGEGRASEGTNETL
jgi:hypothetical protein